MHEHYWGCGHWGWGFPLLPLLVLILILFLAYALFKNVLKNGKNVKGETPLDILKRRFASGEITKEEFEEKTKILGE